MRAGVLFFITFIGSGKEDRWCRRSSVSSLIRWSNGTTTYLFISFTNTFAFLKTFKNTKNNFSKISKNPHFQFRIAYASSSPRISRHFHFISFLTQSCALIRWRLIFRCYQSSLRPIASGLHPHVVLSLLLSHTFISQFESTSQRKKYKKKARFQK